MKLNPHTRYAMVAYFDVNDEGYSFLEEQFFEGNSELESDALDHLPVTCFDELVCICGINFELEELYDYSPYVFDESGMDSPCMTKGTLKLNGVVTPCVIFQDASPCGIYISKEAFERMPVGMKVETSEVSEWFDRHPEYLDVCKRHHWSNNPDDWNEE